MSIKKSYVLDRKVLSIHSDDRDISKWKESNEFEVMLPVDYKKVVSVKMLAIQLPKKYNIFSTTNQNTKLKIDISGTISTITIAHGQYTPAQMANELDTRLKLIDSNMNVHYNDIDMTFYFLHENSDATIRILANENLLYDNGCLSNNVFNNTFNWGLPAYLGFDKLIYTSSTPSENYWLINSSNVKTDILTTYSVIKAPNAAPILGQSDIYIEIEKLNSMDEIAPYTANTTTDISAVSGLACERLGLLRGNRSQSHKNYVSKCNNGQEKWSRSHSGNDYRGKYNSAFAKIPLNLETGATTIHDTAFLSNAYFSEPPIERLSKMKFKFRYHDGQLVDFGNSPLSITMEINQLREDLNPDYNIRVPVIYTP